MNQVKWKEMKETGIQKYCTLDSCLRGNDNLFMGQNTSVWFVQAPVVCLRGGAQ